MGEQSDVRYWHIYETYNRVQLDNPSQVADISLSQQEGLKINDDGSVDLYVGPQAPKGWENNWIETVAGQGVGSPISASTGANQPKATSIGTYATSGLRGGVTKTEVCPIGQQMSAIGT